MMMLPTHKWSPLAMLLAMATGSVGHDHPYHSPYLNQTSVNDPFCTSNVTVFDTTTLLSPTTVYVTHSVDVVVNKTETRIVEECITESSTTTELCTVSVTETDLATVTNTQTTTDTVPATITTYTTTTVLSTSVDPCPTTCSLSVDTVNLMFWPSDRPYTYPSTYYDTMMDYTFTSPSVYMIIPTAQGTNSLGPTGPSTTSWILPLDLEEVSTIVDGSVTEQLTLSDLGTDCPHTAEPSAIATMVNSRCDPILAAPPQVKSWAYPCNACGRFGLFDPPYAVPTLTGGLVESTTVVEPKTTSIPAPTPTATASPSEGDIVVITYVNGDPVGTETVPTTGITGTVTSSVQIWSTNATSQTDPTSQGVTSTPVVAASASQVTSRVAWFIPGLIIAFLLS